LILVFLFVTTTLQAGLHTPEQEKLPVPGLSDSNSIADTIALSTTGLFASDLILNDVDGGGFFINKENWYWWAIAIGILAILLIVLLSGGSDTCD
jgi:hypothetical protein